MTSDDLVRKIIQPHLEDSQFGPTAHEQLMTNSDKNVLDTKVPIDMHNPYGIDASSDEIWFVPTSPAYDSLYIMKPSRLGWTHVINAHYGCQSRAAIRDIVHACSVYNCNKIVFDQFRF